MLAVNPRGSSGRGFDFSRAIYADWGNLDAKDISAGITHAIDSGIADPERIGVGGWSYGGILTDYMIASDARIRAAVSGAGVANVLATFGVDMYVREYLATSSARPGRTSTPGASSPIRSCTRNASPRRPCSSARATTTTCPVSARSRCTMALKTRGVPTRLIVYPGQNHELDVPSYLVHRLRSNIEWFDRWLKRAR